MKGVAHVKLTKYFYTQTHTHRGVSPQSYPAKYRHVALAENILYDTLNNYSDMEKNKATLTHSQTQTTYNKTQDVVSCSST